MGLQGIDKVLADFDKENKTLLEVNVMKKEFRII